MDSIDTNIDVPAVKFNVLRGRSHDGDSSEMIRERVMRTRDVQLAAVWQRRGLLELGDVAETDPHKLRSRCRKQGAAQKGHAAARLFCPCTRSHFEGLAHDRQCRPQRKHPAEAHQRDGKSPFARPQLLDMSENFKGFDQIPQTIPHFCFESFQRRAKREALGFKRGNEWKYLNGAEVIERVKIVAMGMAASRVKAGDRVAIISENRPEWSIVDLAILSLRAVSVPIYTTQSVEQIRFILQNSGAKLFLSRAKSFGSMPKLRFKI